MAGRKQKSLRGRSCSFACCLSERHCQLCWPQWRARRVQPKDVELWSPFIWVACDADDINAFSAETVQLASNADLVHLQEAMGGRLAEQFVSDAWRTAREAFRRAGIRTAEAFQQSICDAKLVAAPLEARSS